MGRVLYLVFEFVVIFVFVKLLGRILSHIFAPPRIHFSTNVHVGQKDEPRTSHHGETARDPVCGMFVSTELSHRLTQGGETIHFCSPECLERYHKDAAHATS
jgi:YHS domain-containing protein